MQHIRRIGSALEVLIATKDPYDPWRIESVLQELSPRSHCVETTNASDALTILRGRPIDFLIADYKLAGSRSGLDLWQIARVLSPRTRFVLMSDLPVGQYLEIVSGFTSPPECIAKPIAGEELTQIIRRYFGGDGEPARLPDRPRPEIMMPHTRHEYSSLNI